MRGVTGPYPAPRYLFMGLLPMNLCHLLLPAPRAPTASPGEKGTGPAELHISLKALSFPCCSTCLLWAHLCKVQTLPGEAGQGFSLLSPPLSL